MIVIVPIVIAGIFLLWVAMIYNSLVKAGNHVKESWAQIDVELKRRYDLIPNLVSTVKGYAAHENIVFEQVARARNAAANNNGSPKSQAHDENALVGVMKSLFAVVENYPDLKASSHFLDLQQELVNTEDRIQRARRFYNGNVRDMNNKVEVFPSNILAGMFGFSSAEYFEINEINRSVPKTDF
jgi:LemA protein